MLLISGQRRTTQIKLMLCMDSGTPQIKPVDTLNYDPEITTWNYSPAGLYECTLKVGEKSAWQQTHSTSDPKLALTWSTVDSYLVSNGS